MTSKSVTSDLHPAADVLIHVVAVKSAAWSDPCIPIMPRSRRRRTSWDQASRVREQKQQQRTARVEKNTWAGRRAVASAKGRGRPRWGVSGGPWPWRAAAEQTVGAGRPATANRRRVSTFFREQKPFVVEARRQRWWRASAVIRSELTWSPRPARPYIPVRCCTCHGLGRTYVYA